MALLQILVLLVTFMLSVLLCFITLMFLKKQNFYIDWQFQYKDSKTACASQHITAREDECPVEEEEEEACPGEEIPAQCIPAAEEANTSRPCQTPRPCQTVCQKEKKPLMKMPSYCLESDSDSQIFDCENLALKFQDSVHEKVRGALCKEKPQKAGNVSKLKRCKANDNNSKEEECDTRKVAKPVISSSGSCSEVSSEWESKHWRQFAKSKDRKSVNCIMLLEDANARLINQTSVERNTNSLLLHTSNIQCLDKSTSPCTEHRAKHARDSSHTLTDPLKDCDLLKMSSKETASENVKNIERNVRDPQKECQICVLTEEKSEEGLTLLPLSIPNLEKVREKRKERKKTLMKLQYESEKLDNINKWISGTSNSDNNC